jgi:hypothetical protein
MTFRQGSECLSIERVRSIAGNRWKLSLCGLVFVLIFPCQAQTPAPVAAGFVAEVHGEWVTVLGDPNWIVSQRSPVFAGQRIRARHPEQASSITIIQSIGSTISVHCPQDTDACKAPIVIVDQPALRIDNGSSPNSRTSYRQIVDAVIKLVGRQDSDRVLTVARDVFGPQPAVLSWKGDQLDLRPALSMVPDGAYLAELVPESHDSHVAKPARYPATVTSSRAVAVTIPGLRRGLYRLALFSVEESEPVGEPALVLVVSTSDFESSRDSFAQAREMTSRWGDNIEPGIVQNFLTTYLRALAEGGEAH